MKWPNHKTLFWLAAFSLLLAVILTYSNHFSNSFHFDDFHTIVDNPYIRSLDNTWSFFSNPNTYSILSMNNHCYRPLCVLTAAIDYKLGGGYNPFYFHLTSFFWYLAQLFFMFILFRAVFNCAYKHDWNNWLALFGVAWYGLHTANTETINYISARSDLLSTALVIIALVSYAYSPFMRKYFLYLIPFVLGILAKQSAFMFVPLFFLYLLLFEEKKIWQALAKTIPAVIAAGIFLQITLPMVFGLASGTNIPIPSYLISQTFMALYYFKNFFLPTGLCADYGWEALTTVFDARFFLGAVFLMTMFFASYYFSRIKKYRPIAFGLLWFILALLPSSIMPLTEIINDHRVFFPFVGLAMAVCWTMGLFLYRYEKEIKGKTLLKSIIIFICLFVLLANAFGTRRRNEVWKDEESLWHDVTIKSPHNGRGLMNYGLARMNKGDYIGALKYYKEALKRLPYYVYIYINLGAAEDALGHNPEAEKDFKKAVGLA